MLANIKHVNSTIICTAGDKCLSGDLEMCQMPMSNNAIESKAQNIAVCYTEVQTGIKECVSSKDDGELLIARQFC